LRRVRLVETTYRLRVPEGSEAIARTLPSIAGLRRIAGPIE
jgi:hypothetical protein